MILSETEIEYWVVSTFHEMTPTNSTALQTKNVTDISRQACKMYWKNIINPLANKLGILNCLARLSLKFSFFKTCHWLQQPCFSNTICACLNKHLNKRIQNQTLPIPDASEEDRPTGPSSCALKRQTQLDAYLHWPITSTISASVREMLPFPTAESPPPYPSYALEGGGPAILSSSC